MSKRKSWVPPANLVSEVPIRIKGVSRYQITCRCTKCGNLYVANGRESIVGRKTTLCAHCIERTVETREKISDTLIKHYQNPNNRLEISQIMRGKMAGPLHWNWQGGLSSKNQRNRNSLEYKTWRDSIFHRDNYTCVMCESQGNKLVAHHVLNWSNNEMFRFNVDNGITLCESCHYFTHKCLELDTKIKHMLLKEST